MLMKEGSIRHGGMRSGFAAWRVGLALLGLAALLETSAQAASYGQINFNNRVGGVVIAPVYGPDPANPGLPLRGPGTTNFGTQVYNGPPLFGTGYSAAIFAGVGVVEDEDLLVWQTSALFRTNPLVRGYIQPPVLGPFITVAPPDSLVTLQLRAWDNRGGTATNWDQVLADPTLARGSSKLFTVIPRIVPAVPAISTNRPGLGLRQLQFASCACGQ